MEAPSRNTSTSALPSQYNQFPTLPSLAKLLLLAKQPLCHTMYVWGGGWNEADTSAGIEARSLGLSPNWASFAAKQDSSYDYRTTRFQIHDGLDCSGYIGWLLYNLFETENDREGYVFPAHTVARELAARGFGTFTPAEQVTDWQAGDILSSHDHVWLSLGMCKDNSVVMLHATPPGVILSGSKLKDGKGESLAERLAASYMKTYYPNWYARFTMHSRDHRCLLESARLRWSRDVLQDTEGLRGRNANEVLQFLFENPHSL